MKRDEMLDYARAGLKAEIAALTAKLEALGTVTKRVGRGATKQAAAVTEAVAGKVRKRRKRTAAERKAVSIRMKKYWAGRRKGEKK